MKRVSTLFACLLACAVVLPAQAHGGGGPVLGAALVGSVLYAASTPSYVVQAPPVVVMPQQTMPPARVAYFCSASQQYYPQVPSCPVPWQLVNY